MTFQSAATLVQRLGPCCILHANAGDLMLMRELLLLGCDAWAIGPGPTDGADPRVLAGAAPASRRFDAVVLELRGLGSGADVLDSLGRLPTAPDLVLLSTGQADRLSIEGALFANGWRRHPGGLQAGEYAALDDRRLSPLSLYQRAAPPHVRTRDDAALETACDALRASSPEADARIARYALAAQYVRPGDVVLACDGGAGEGAAILAALSRAGSVVAVGPERSAPVAARRSYGQAGAEYRCADIATLSGVADHSLDVVVAFDAIERAADLSAQLQAFERVLKPDGRLIAGLRTGPPASGRVSPDWPAFSAAICQRFILEARHVQTVPGQPGSPGAARGLYPVPLEGEHAAAWQLAVASANPLEGEARRAAYRHPAFATGSDDPPAVIDFGRGYDNPYLYRVMVQMGERLGDETKLMRLAEHVVSHARPASADRGAAITVLGYRVLEHRAVAAAPQILDLIKGYETAACGVTGAPHVARWRVSLAFLAGRLHEMTGRRPEALAWYRRASAGDWRAFSPLLATKAVAGAFFEGRLRLAQGETDLARDAFRRGVATALEAVARPSREFVGDAADPIPFGLQEMAEVMDMGSQCANALAHLGLWRRDRGLFWRQVDVRRFGLASWTRDVDRENERLRALVAAGRTG